ncbi:polymorphic toxin-type HINT domain-containing protein [Actinosynnema sp. NPDC020468]|uniref:polymorphic toxin-type HINT domain-containing protein n=1 Tax=Actinosynnema sp. NPDC020468 TaxID=3154488 RepID=UPI0033D2A8A4
MTRIGIVVSFFLGLVVPITPPAALADLPVGVDGAAATTGVPQTAVSGGDTGLADPPPATDPPAGDPRWTVLDKVRTAQAEEAERVKARHSTTPVGRQEAATVEAAAPVRAVAGEDRKSPRRFEVVANVDPCAPIGTEQWFARYGDGALLTTPTNTTAGTARVGLTNLGSQTWLAGHTYLGYQLFTDAGVAVPGNYPLTPVPFLARNQSTTVTATIGQLAPGSWRIAWDVYVDGLGWFSANGVCAMTIRYTIQNQPPNLTLQLPPNYGTVTTRMPTLSVTGSDVDQWPGGALSYQFTVCRDAALTQSCHTSGWQTGTGYPLPQGVLAWNDVFFWSARVSDGNKTTPAVGWAPPNQVTAVVPAPEAWRTVGTGLGMVTIAGVVLPYGIWLHSETDATVNATGLPLRVQRTYSTGAKNTAGAFGRGWMSMFDASAQQSQDGQLMTVTYPDGRQEIFGRQGAGWVTRAETGSTNRLSIDGAGVVTLRESAQEVLTYGPAGELRSIASAGEGSIVFGRNAAGQVTTVTHQPSGRVLTVSWTTNQGNGCAAGIPPMIGEIATEAPFAGADVPRWTYRYSCGALSSVTNPLGEIVGYNTGADVQNWWRRSSENRTVKQPNDSGWSDSQAWSNKFDSRTIHADLPDGSTTLISMAKANPAYYDDYLNQYNSLGGVMLEANAGYRTSAGFPTGDVAQNHQTYRFDELNRLRTLQSGGAFTHNGPTRSWSYNEVNGHFDGFFDENRNGFEATWDAYGNQNGRFTMRDASTQVTHTSQYDEVPGLPAGETRMKYLSITPRQDNALNYDQFGYDTQGRLTRSTGNPTPENPNGASATYTYTTGAEAAVGSRRGGSGGGTMPAGLTRTTVEGGVTTTYDYNANGDLSQVRLQNGKRDVYDYDNLGRRTHVIEYTNAYPAGITTRYYVDPIGRVVSELHPPTTNLVTQSTAQRRVCRVYDRDGFVVRTVESGSTDQCPLITLERRPGERTTETSYDNAGRVTRVVDAAGGVTTYTFGLDGVWYDGVPLLPLFPNGLPYDRAVTRVTTPENRVTESVFVRGRVVETRKSGVTGSVTLATRNVYDVAGRLTEQSDALGRKTRFDYTWDDQLASATQLAVRQPDGSLRDVPLFTRQYDGAGRVTSEVTGGVRRLDSYYDGEGKLVDTTLDATGLDQKAHRVYNGRGQLARIVLSGGGKTVESSWCPAVLGPPTCEVVGSTTQSSQVTSYTRDQRGLPVGVVPPEGHKIDWEDPAQVTYDNTFDELGRLTKTTAPQVQAQENGGAPVTARPTQTFGYNVFGERTHVKDAKGNVTETLYDDAGRQVETRAPGYTPPGSSSVLYPVAKRAYNLAGDLISSTDPDNRVTEYEYNGAGLLFRVKEPDAGQGRPVTEFGYDNAGQSTHVVGPTGARTEFAYDGLGRQVATTSVVRQPNGSSARYTTAYEYDDVGNVTATVSPSGARHTAEYDKAGRVTKVWAPGVTNPTAYEYDVAGRTTKVTDPAGRASVTDYDEPGRVTATRHLAPGGAVLDETTYAHNVPNTVTARWNDTHLSTFYDMLGRETGAAQALPDGTVLSSQTGYDVLGNVTSSTDGNHRSTVMTYNTIGLPETITEPSTTAHPAVSDRRWTATYDRAGAQTKLVKPGGVTVDSTYDALGRRTAEHGYGGGVADTTRSFGYDLTGRMTSATNPAGTIDFTYSDRGSLLSSVGLHTSSTFEYDANGAMTVRRDPWATTTVGYRPDGQIATLADSLQSTTSTYNYSTLTGALNSTSLSNGVSTRWQYDGRGRVSGVAATNAAGADVFRAVYGYDSRGNLTSNDVQVGPPSGGTYTYDKADRLTSWTPEDGAPERRYTWDANGNRTKETTVVGGTPVQTGSWTYDERDRLTSSSTVASGQTTNRTYGYSPRGGLLSTAVAGGSTSTSTFSAFEELVSDGGVGYGYDALGRVTSRGAGEFWYVGFERDAINALGQLDRRDPAGRLVASWVGGESAVPVSNPHGDVVGWNPVGQTSAAPRPLRGTTSYDPFGARVASTGDQSARGFQSDWTDPTTGRVYMDSRWYTPSTGSFVSRDSADVANRYAYGDANPTSNVDPDGHKPYPMVCQNGGACEVGYRNTATNQYTTPDQLAMQWAPFAVLSRSQKHQFVTGERHLIEFYSSGGDALVEKLVETLIDKVYDKALAEPLAAAVLGSILGAEAPEWAVGLGAAALMEGVKWLLGPLPDVLYDASEKDYFRPLVGGKIFWCGCPDPVNTPTGRTVQTPGKPPTPKPVPVPPGTTTAPPPPPPHVVFQTTLSLVGSWSTWSTYHTSTRRYVRLDNYSQTWSDTVTGWSNGRISDTGWRMTAWSHGWQYWWAPTVDPFRVSGDWTGGVLPWAGTTDQGWAAPGATGRCGLTGTLTSCLAEVSAPPVGGGCAGVDATVQSCAPVAPVPGAKPAVREAGGAQGCAPNSFTPETPVLMADGTHRPIGQVRVGDRVRATDPVTGVTRDAAVLDVIVGSGSKHLVSVDFGGRSVLTATDNHPFWTGDRWVEAGDLAAGDHLVTATGGTETVVGTRDHSAFRTVFNLTVEGVHTFFVGEDDVLVHNSGDGSTAGPFCGVHGGDTGSPEPLGVFEGPAPQSAHDMLAMVNSREGGIGQVPGYIGNKGWGNNRDTLPGGKYREWDVNLTASLPTCVVCGRPIRGPERLVTPRGGPGPSYYTPDHYRTFYYVGPST